MGPSFFLPSSSRPKRLRTELPCLSLSGFLRISFSNDSEMILTPHLLHGFGGEWCQRKGTKCNTRVMGVLEPCPSVTAETGPSSAPPCLRYPKPEHKPQTSAPSSMCPERTSPASQPLGPQGALWELAPLLCASVCLCVASVRSNKACGVRFISGNQEIYTPLSESLT